VLVEKNTLRRTASERDQSERKGLPKRGDELNSERSNYEEEVGIRGRRLWKERRRTGTTPRGLLMRDEYTVDADLKFSGSGKRGNDAKSRSEKNGKIDSETVCYRRLHNEERRQSGGNYTGRGMLY